MSEEEIKTEQMEPEITEEVIDTQEPVSYTHLTLPTILRV